MLSLLRSKAETLLLAGVGGASAATTSNLDKMLDGMLYDMPIRSLAMVANGAMTPAKIQGVVDVLNGHLLRGARALLQR